MLRLAACLEEHFPHSMANAVVEEARRRGLNHEERHATVEYLVAHGIVSSVDGSRARNNLGRKPLHSLPISGGLLFGSPTF